MKTFNIRFMNDCGQIDETQFDLMTDVFGTGEIDAAFMMEQLLDLWEEFRRENGMEKPRLFSICEVPYDGESEVAV